MVKKPTYEDLEQMVKELERGIAKSQVNGKRFRDFVDHLGDAVYETDLNGNMTYLNEMAGKLVGRPIEELIGKQFLSLFIKESQEIAIAEYQKTLNGKSPTYELTLTSGVTAEFQNQPRRDKDGNITGVFGKAIDVTAQKLKEEALREIEYCYKTLIGGPLFAMIIHDMEVYFATKKAANLFGYNSPEDLINSIKDIEELFKEEYRVNMKEKRARRYKTKETSIVELVGLRKDGIEVPLLVGINVTDWKGEPAIQCTYYDITELKKAQKALGEHRKQLETILSTVPCWVTITEMYDGKILDVNDYFSVLSGFPREEVIGKTPIELGMINEADRGSFIKILKKQGEVDNLEVTYKRKDGTPFDTLLSARPIIYQGKDCLISAAVDITERKLALEALWESEEKLARLRKMESLGLLAGGVAHDLNNILSGIVSYPELLLLGLPEDSKLRKPIETMQESGYRAAAIVEDLLTVARGVAIARETMNLNDIVINYLNSPEFIKLKKFHPTVTVKTELDHDVINVSVSNVHIRKVLMNLISNASEAIEGSGKVTISTMNCYVDKPLMGYDDVTMGEYALLAVSDDGSGISSDDLERIFEPFYTKKVMGRSGTGLGLAVVWNIVQDHKGYINVTSDENSTTFELYFPISIDEVIDKDLSIPIKDYKGNGETILVVDDVEMQREISCNILDTLSYKTKALSSGEEAVEYLKEHTVDLILLDMIMDPGINGRETYERILKIHPNQKAIIVSGFAETDAVKEAQKLGAGQYIKKPLTIERVGLAVKEELEK